MDSEVLGSVSWRNGREKNSFPLRNGKYYIGNSEYCHIKIDYDYGDPGIAALLIVDQNKIFVRCTGDMVPIRNKGVQMRVGDEVQIGLRLELVVGRSRISIEKSFSLDDPDFTGSDDELDGWIHGNTVSLKEFIASELLNSMKVEGIEISEIESHIVRQKIRVKLREIIASLKLDTNVERISEAELENDVFSEVTGLGPLEKLLSDKTITEIMINRYDQVYIEKSGKLQLSELAFNSEQSLLFVIERIVSTVGRRIDTSSPVVDARLLDGSRVNAIIPPISLKGACLTIRRFPEKPISVDELVNWKSMTVFTKELLKAFVESHMNIVVSGGTGSGKTTLLNALSSFIGPKERIITIEDAAELQLQQEHVISLETRPSNVEGKGKVSIQDLVKNCLRMRPDRIVVGECRGGEALDMLQAMNTGHDGSLTTGHANTPEDMLRRLETMVLMSGVDFPLRAIREQINSAVHIVIQQTRLHTGRRLVTHIVWVKDLNRETNEYITADLVTFKKQEGTDQGEHAVNLKNLRELAAHFSISDRMGRLIDSFKNDIVIEEA